MHGPLRHCLLRVYPGGPSVDGRCELFQLQTLRELAHEDQAVQGALIVKDHAVRRARQRALPVDVVLPVQLRLIAAARSADS